LSFNVLIVEDEPIPATYLKAIIEDNSNYKVIDIVPSADKALSALQHQKVDIVCLDIMLKGSQDGARLSLEIRDKYPNIEIIFLTAYSENEMLEFASEANSFAYLLKPYRPEEIKATFKLLERKLKIESSQATVINNRIKLIDNYLFDIEKETLYQKDKEVFLGKKELEFLSFLCHNLNITLDKDTILNRLNISDSSLRSIIYRIRKETSKDLILSIKKYGYKVATI